MGSFWLSEESSTKSGARHQTYSRLLDLTRVKVDREAIGCATHPAGVAHQVSRENPFFTAAQHEQDVPNKLVIAVAGALLKIERDKTDFQNARIHALSHSLEKRDYFTKSVF